MSCNILLHKIRTFEIENDNHKSNKIILTIKLMNAHLIYNEENVFSDPSGDFYKVTHLYKADWMIQQEQSNIATNRRPKQHICSNTDSKVNVSNKIKKGEDNDTDDS